MMLPPLTMKPIAIIILALPIVIFVHHTQPIGKTVTAQRKISGSQVKPTIATAAVISPKVIATAPTPPTPSPIIYTSGCNNYQSTFSQYNWNVNIAMAICQAESSGNPNASSSTNDYGLMQIHDGLDIYGSKIFNPYFNISVAYSKYQNQGWEAWSTYNSGIFRNYL